MGTSRRDFLKKGSLVALAAGVPVSMAERVTGKTISQPENSTFHLTKSAFAAQLNTKFEIGTKPSTIVASLSEVTDLKVTDPLPKEKEGFTLLFRTSGGLRLKQDTYTINHKKLGTFSLLLVPMKTADADASHFEAVINRLYS